MGTSSFLVDRDQNINFISWGWHQVITACWNYTLSTITHFLQSHTFFNHTLSTSTHFIQAHTFYNHTLSTITAEETHETFLDTCVVFIELDTMHAIWPFNITTFPQDICVFKNVKWLLNLVPV